MKAKDARLFARRLGVEDHEAIKVFLDDPDYLEQWEHTRFLIMAYQHAIISLKERVEKLEKEAKK